MPYRWKDRNLVFICYLYLQDWNLAGLRWYQSLWTHLQGGQLYLVDLGRTISGLRRGGWAKCFLKVKGGTRIFLHKQGETRIFYHRVNQKWIGYGPSQTDVPLSGNDCSLITQKVFSFVLYCVGLNCIALYYIVLYCFVLYCIVLYCFVLYCIVLYSIVLHCIV